VRAGRLALLVAVALTVAVASGAASTASAAAASAHHRDGLCHLFPWLSWCHHDDGDCDHPRHHHPHPGDCGEPGGGDPGNPGGPGPGDPGGAGGPGGPGGSGSPGAGAPAPGAPGGTPGAGGAGTIAADTRAPSFLAKPRLHPTRFRAARGRGASTAVRTGTTIVYRLSESARVSFTVQKHRALSRVCRRKLAARNSRHRTGLRCKRWISLRGRFAKASVAGPNSVRFTGRLKRRPLRPGSYRFVIRARDAAGNVTRPKRPKFRIIR
jgi:hypothetical protein